MNSLNASCIDEKAQIDVKGEWKIHGGRFIRGGGASYDSWMEPPVPGAVYLAGTCNGKGSTSFLCDFPVGPCLKQDARLRRSLVLQFSSEVLISMMTFRSGASWSRGSVSHCTKYYVFVNLGQKSSSMHLCI